MHIAKLEPIAEELNNLIRHTKEQAAAAKWTRNEMMAVSPEEAVQILQARIDRSNESLRKLGFVAPGSRLMPRADG